MHLEHIQSDQRTVAIRNDHTASPDGHKTQTTTTARNGTVSRKCAESIQLRAAIPLYSSHERAIDHGMRAYYCIEGGLKEWRRGDPVDMAEREGGHFEGTHSIYMKRVQRYSCT